MMKNKIILTGLTLLIFGCSSPVSQYQNFLQSWIGKSEAELVETWGAPDEMQTIAPNRQIFVYIKSRKVTINGSAMPPQYIGQNSAYTQSSNSFEQELTYYCQTTFTTQDDIIVDYAFEGDGCRM